MDISDFDYDLPENLIAQTPLTKRSDSKLLILDRISGSIEHPVFKNIIDYLHEGDVLVLNDTKVIPARLIGIKEDTMAHIELLLLNDMGNDIWECLSRPQKRLHIGSIISFGDGMLKAKVMEILDDGIVHVKLVYTGILFEILDKLGEMPLPPYIHDKLNEQSMYQTVYAKYEGSAAAPTAGLHFTTELLAAIEEKGVTLAYVTLHVGLGTFRPVQVEDVTKHVMHTESYVMSADAANLLNKARESGQKIFAVGTTSTRVLETNMHKYNKCTPEVNDTSIFIYPGFEFKGIDSLITNFHLPKSTLVMLVSALAGKDNIMHAYKEAVDMKYRFFSFGDAMLILDDEEEK